MQIRSRKLGELRQAFRQELATFYAPEELGAIERELFSFLSGLSPSKMVLEKDTSLTESQIFTLQRAAKRLKAQEPLQYILQQAHFRGLDFFVDQRVLIPRSETEELVGWVMENGIRDGEKVLDVGTGSGCIAISLKKENSGAEVYAVDVSPDALEVARKNAGKLGVQINFHLLDILNPKFAEELPIYDMIISNPPYVTPTDRRLMKDNVTRYEPHLALFVEEDDPLIFYREIIRFSQAHLVDKGRIFLECNERSAMEVARMLSSAEFKNVEIRKDMKGKERFVMGAGFRVPDAR